MSKYQNKWWYVEGPHFPYILLLGWPFVWVWGFVHDLVDRRRIAKPVRNNCRCNDAGPFSGDPHRHMGFLGEDE